MKKMFEGEHICVWKIHMDIVFDAKAGSTPCSWTEPHLILFAAHHGPEYHLLLVIKLTSRILLLGCGVNSVHCISNNPLRVFSPFLVVSMTTKCHTLMTLLLIFNTSISSPNFFKIFYS